MLSVIFYLTLDMEWIVGKGGNEVDIGYVPLMRAYSTQSNSNLDHTDHDKDLSWNQEISLNEASQIIEKKMYPFKEVINKINNTRAFWGLFGSSSNPVTGCKCRICLCIIMYSEV